MGRRKIEIKAIKDDRNRSVTFLKRKGGLFKKAHELSVLCSVDVAVIIFGHNKKLYEFSSGDINETIGRYQYYGTPHEHKGPADFVGKKVADDDEDDEDAATPPGSHSSQDQQHMQAPSLQNQPGYQHITHHTPSVSPPVPNGMPFHQRHGTPQPQVGSRPSSRNTIRRTSSNLAPHAQLVPPPPPPPPPQGSNGYAYMANPPIYNPQAGAGMPMAPQPGQQPHYQYPHPRPPPSQAQQVYMQDQRRQSMPPAFPQQERLQPVQSTTSPPQPPRPADHPPNLPTLETKLVPAKSRSIFTPIDDSRSLLAQHWGIGTTAAEPSRVEALAKPEGGPRAQSVDVGSVSRNNATARPPAPPPGPPPKRPPPPSQRTLPAPGEISAPARPASAQAQGGKRPRLKVQIPEEQSEGGSATAESSPRVSGGTAAGTPMKASHDLGPASGVVLPPPSPSASALLSAGASGPPNPFARPPPPAPSVGNTAGSGGPYGSASIETPISALPSRFVADGLLPSPSSFYPEWGFGRSGGDSNMLPSPLNFQTPVGATGPSFLRDDEADRKRKSPEGQSSEGESNKRVKT